MTRTDLLVKASKELNIQYNTLVLYNETIGEDHKPYVTWLEEQLLIQLNNDRR